MNASVQRIFITVFAGFLTKIYTCSAVKGYTSAAHKLTVGGVSFLLCEIQQLLPNHKGFLPARTELREMVYRYSRSVTADLKIPGILRFSLGILEILEILRFKTVCLLLILRLDKISRLFSGNV